MLLDTDEYADHLIKSKMMERISGKNESRGALMDGLEAEMQQINAEKEQVVVQAEVELSSEQEIAALERPRPMKKKNEMDSCVQSGPVVKQLQSDISYTEQQLKRQAQEEALNQQIVSSHPFHGNLPGNTRWRHHVLAGARCAERHSSGWLSSLSHACTAVSIFLWERFGVWTKVVVRRGRRAGHLCQQGTNTWGGGYGYHVIIDHGLDDQARSICNAHNSQVLVNGGDKVVGGQTVISRRETPASDGTAPPLLRGCCGSGENGWPLGIKRIIVFLLQDSCGRNAV